MSNVNGHADCKAKLAALVEAANMTCGALHLIRQEFLEQGQGFAAKYVLKTSEALYVAIAEARK